MRHKATHSKKNNSGFTLVEILVSIGILSFLGVAIVTFQLSVLKNTASMQAGLISQQQVRKTLLQFSREVRTAIDAPNGGAALLEVATSTLVFYSNVDADVDIERIKYYLGTTTPQGRTELYRQVINPIGGVYLNANQELTTMVQHIAPTTTPLFTYYDANYSGTTSPLVQPVTTTAVRLIKIFLPVVPNSASTQAIQTYSTQVTLRNLKDNL